MVQKSAIIEKKEHYMKKGFTLSELLLSLIIVGVVAVLTIPVLMNNVQHKTFATQVKNMSAMIEQMAQDELIAKHTKNLADTDFSDPTKLLSDNHFSIAKKCTSDESLTKCWKTEATGKEKVTYKMLNRAVNTGFPQRLVTIILKNGVIISYGISSSPNALGAFTMDINGNDKPNIAGRDLFVFHVNNKGHVVGYNVVDFMNKNLEQLNQCCKNSTGIAARCCYDALADNGWKMDY